MRRPLIVILPLLLFSFACDSGSVLEPVDVEPEMHRWHGDGGTRTWSVPFISKFSVWDVSDYTDTRCGGYPVFFLTMEGSGRATFLGKATTRMTFCCNVVTGEYWDTKGHFVAANGDSLFLEIPTGLIVPNEGRTSEYYQTRFDDDAVFVGGTGRFEGASGSWTTNAFVHDGEDEWRTDFFGRGMLKLQKEKKRRGRRRW